MTWVTVKQLLDVARQANVEVVADAATDYVEVTPSGTLVIGAHGAGSEFGVTTQRTHQQIIDDATYFEVRSSVGRGLATRIPAKEFFAGHDLLIPALQKRREKDPDAAGAVLVLSPMQNRVLHDEPCRVSVPMNVDTPFGPARTAYCLDCKLLFVAWVGLQRTT